jgi:hypothetical protein
MADIQDAVIGIMRNSRVMTGRNPRLLISDLGTEFVNSKITQYCEGHGIQMQPSPPRVKELNGLAEKSVDTVKNHARTMLHAAGIEGTLFHDKAIVHHIYLWNRTHIGNRTNKTPYESMMKRTPSVQHVGEFGCDTWVTVDRAQRDTTFSQKAEEGIYLGHDNRLNCARVMLLSTGKIVHSKDVRYREGSFKHAATLKTNQADITVEEEECVTTASTIQSCDKRDNSRESETQDSPATRKFDVSRVLGTRVHDGEKQYRVKWTRDPNPTWEPASSIEEDVPELVKEYEERQTAQRTVTRVTRSSARASEENSAASSTEAGSRDESEADTQTAVSLAAMDAAWCL